MTKTMTPVPPVIKIFATTLGDCEELKMPSSGASAISNVPISRSASSIRSRTVLGADSFTRQAR